MHDRTVPLPRDGGAPASGSDEDAAQARLAMVARLEADGDLTDPAVREALLAVRREVLLPRAYVRRNAPGAQPGVWQLLDGAHRQDRAEWLELIHSGASVLVQHDGEPLGSQRRGTVSGGSITGMSSVMAMTVHTLQALRLRPGGRYLELGTGAGVTAALAARILGTGAVTTVESDRHLADAADARLAALGLGVRVVTGDGLAGYATGGPYDRVLATFSVPCLPQAWLDQLADGGRLLATLTTAPPSWPGEAVVRRRGRRLEGQVAGVWSGHRPVNGHQWLVVADHRHLVGRGPVRRRRAIEPPAKDAYGFWLAVAYLVPGVVRDFAAEHLTLIAPGEDSWAVVRPDGHGGWLCESGGRREIWAEVEAVHGRWCAAECPSAYHLELPRDGTQHVTSANGALHWTLPARTRATPTGRRG